MYRDDLRQHPDFLDRIDATAKVGLKDLRVLGLLEQKLPAVRAKADALGFQIATFCCEAPGALVDPANTAAWVEGAKASSPR